MNDEHEPEDAQYGIVCPFWIDTDAYTDRDRAMFVAGAEFSGILNHVRHNPDSLSTTVHRENESRIRMACGRFGRKCRIEACGVEHDPNGTWSFLEIEAAS